MPIKHAYFIILFALLCIEAPPLYAKPERATRSHLIAEQYSRTKKGDLLVAGFQFDKFIGKNWFYSLSILEAIGGDNHAGYAIASYGLGYSKPLTHTLEWNSVVFIGGGGGGQFNKSELDGGYTVKYQTGLHHTINSRIGIEANVGWLTFPEGDIQSYIYSMGITHQNNLTPKKKEKTSTKPNDIISFETKQLMYNKNTKEIITLIGGRHKHFTHPNMYLSYSGFAATTGGRHGYIEGAVGIGWRTTILTHFYADFGTTIGAAGGGGNEEIEGTGLNSQTILEVGTHLTDKVSIGGQVGYLAFLEGEIKSPMAGINLSYHLPPGQMSLKNNTQTSRDNLFWEQYVGPRRDGIEALVAYYHDMFLNKNLFVSYGTSWSTLGKRPGYGKAMVGSGYQWELTKNWTYDIRGYVGVGGHQQLELGDAYVWMIQNGLTYQINAHIAAKIQYGYLDYPSGHYNAGVISHGISITL
ncbi:MAG: hypothetical protein O3A01_07075 [bacterium]|nr:hypothetical protein [bacterium]